MLIGSEIRGPNLGGADIREPKARGTKRKKVGAPQRSKIYRRKRWIKDLLKW